MIHHHINLFLFFSGAGIFVSTVVAGTISIAHPFHAMERPFLRDIIFYIGTVFMTFCILYDGEISLIESISEFSPTICIITLLNSLTNFKSSISEPFNHQII